MSFKNIRNGFILLVVLIAALQTSDASSDFETISLGKDVLSGSVNAEEPIEVTTKKSGFFSGIKNFFSKSSTEAPIITTTTTTTISPPVQPPLKPQSPPSNGGNIAGQQTIGTNNRDYVNPNVKPGINPVRPQQGAPSYPNNNALSYPIINPTSSTPNPNRDFAYPNIGPNAGIPARSPLANINNNPLNPTSSPTPSNRRDYVAPIRPGSPSQPVTPDNINQLNPTSTISSNNRRDYVAPIRPGAPINPQHPDNKLNGNINPLNPTSTSLPNNRRDYVAPIRPVSPNAPASGSSGIPINSQQSSPTVLPTPSSNRRDYVNPNLPTPKSPIIQPAPSPNHPQVPHSGGGRRDYVNPSIPGGQAQPQSPFDSKDFPALPTPKNANKNVPSTVSTNSVWGSSTNKPPNNNNRVSFVPHQPPVGNTGSAGDNKQLATDTEIETLTENLLSKDTNNQNRFITLNIQGKTKSTDRTDEAPNKLLEVDEQALASPTIEKMRLLFNNYEVDTTVNEYVTPIERKEENEFMDAIMATTVMRQAMQFLQSKGIVTPDPKTHRDLVKTIWFTLYSRGGGRIGSSAFEHVFLNEVKNGTVIGLHNWVYYYEEEKAGRIDYKGYIRKVDLGNKGAILKYRFDYNGLQKYANTLFVGTSPELELAIYTVCFQLRPDKDCPISLNNNKINIVTHTWRYRGKNLIGSAYPEI